MSMIYFTAPPSRCQQTGSFPDANALLYLADMYGVSVDYILGRAGDEMLFDDARVPKSEVQELFDKLNTSDKGKAIGYMQSLLDTRDDRN